MWHSSHTIPSWYSNKKATHYLQISYCNPTTLTLNIWVISLFLAHASSPKACPVKYTSSTTNLGKTLIPHISKHFWHTSTSHYVPFSAPKIYPQICPFYSQIYHLCHPWSSSLPNVEVPRVKHALNTEEFRHKVELESHTNTLFLHYSSQTYWNHPCTLRLTIWHKILIANMSMLECGRVTVILLCHGKVFFNQHKLHFFDCQNHHPRNSL